MLHITWERSCIGYPRRQRDTLRSLGLRRIGQSVLRPDDATVRGMLRQVDHLVRVEQSEGDDDRAGA